MAMPKQIFAKALVNYQDTKLEDPKAFEQKKVEMS